jgi:hypothetical protein
MAGHYPPVCYPAHGWSEDPNDRVVLELAVEGREIPLTRYEISRDREDGLGRSRVFVFNFFVAPSREQTLFADQPALETLRHRDERLFEGVAQFQVLIDASVPEEERRAMLRRAIGAMWGAVRAVEGVTG